MILYINSAFALKGNQLWAQVLWGGETQINVTFLDSPGRVNLLPLLCSDTVWIHLSLPILKHTTVFCQIMGSIPWLSSLSLVVVVSRLLECPIPPAQGQLHHPHLIHTSGVSESSRQSFMIQQVVLREYGSWPVLPGHLILYNFLVDCVGYG